ncbi:MAG: patatin-like phospholipase family protein [Burkholderiaceae bacterium]
MFERVVFAGGGHRCWWQAGWWETVAPVAGLAPSRIAAVSAGAATACLLYANNSATALAHYRSVLGPSARNAYWGRWRDGRSGVFPHEQIYRNALAILIGDHFPSLLRNAPEIRIAYARPPNGLTPTFAIGLGLLGYNLEKYLLKPLHPRLGRRLGFHADYRTVRSCQTADELIDLILASSCTPPFTGIQYQDGKPTLDGGLVDNVPVDVLDQPANFSPASARDSPSPAGSVQAVCDQPDTLVLVTRRYPGYDPVFRVGNRVYVQPTRKVPASSWDYTSPADYEATDAQGREDATGFLRWLENFKNS